MKKLIFGIIMTCFLQADLVQQSYDYPAVKIDERLQCDLELIMNGGFAPLDGFLKEGDYNSVLANMRLENGALWPMPIVLPIDDAMVEKVRSSEYLTLRDEHDTPLAMIRVESIYKPDVIRECEAVFGCADDNHPYIQRTLLQKGCHYVGGKVTKIAMPTHFDFEDLRMTPAQCKAYMKEQKWDRVVGFQTRNPLHQCHVALTRYAMKEADAKLLLHPVVGVTQPGDIDHYRRVKCYQALLKYYPKGSVKLALLPLSMRMAGPREALWHALIRKNHGCTHFVVGRDHAGPSFKRKDGEAFFDPYGAHELIAKHKDEVGIDVIPSKEIVYVEDTGKYVAGDMVPEGATVKRLSGTQFRKMLLDGSEIPSWFSYPEVIALLRKEFDTNKGTCFYFTGLSGSGKTTLCNALHERLKASTDRKVIILDGDVIRKYLSNGLGFTRNDRSINVRRIGYVASLIVENGGICLCANIAPYRDDRESNRHLISSKGNYVEVFVDTPLNVCEMRDVKGLYKLARAGKIKEFTGISDPYELPEKPDLVLDGSAELNETVDRLIKQAGKLVPGLFL